MKSEEVKRLIERHFISPVPPTAKSSYPLKVGMPAANVVIIKIPSTFVSHVPHN